MPQFSTSKKSLNATGPRAKHERKYDHLDFRPYDTSASSTYSGVLVKTTKTNRIVVAQRRYSEGVTQRGQVSIFSVDRDGILYNRVTVFTGPNAFAEAGYSMEVYSEGNDFTVALGYNDTNGLGYIYVARYTVSGESTARTYSATITNPDTSGTSGLGGGDDDFGREGILLLNHDLLIIGVDDYIHDGSNTTPRGRYYAFRRQGSPASWQLVRTVNSLSGAGGFGSTGSISGRMIGTEARFVVGNWAYNNPNGGSLYDGETIEYSIPANNQESEIRTLRPNSGGQFGRGVLVTDDYTIISANQDTTSASNGDRGAIWVYDNDPWQLRFILTTPPIDFPFYGGTGGQSNFGLTNHRMAVDNNILYVTSSQARSVGGTGQTLGAIAKYDLITGQFIDYNHVPQRNPYNSNIGESIAVYEGRAFIYGPQDYYENAQDSYGIGIYVVDDLVKPSTFWDSFPSVKALEQIIKKAEFGSDITYSTTFYGGQPMVKLERSSYSDVSNMSFNLDLSNDYLTIEVITRSSELSRYQCVLYLEHATDSTKDLSMHIQPGTGLGFSPAGGCGFRPGGTQNGTNWITISHTANANKHWGITFQKQTNNNYLLFNNGATFYGSDSNVYIDNAQNYVRAYLFRDPNEQDNYLSGNVLQVKISQAAPYGAPTASVGQGPNYTNPVTNEDRIQPGDGTVLYWEVPTTRY